MVIDVSIESDIEEALAEVGEFFRKQVPFTMALAINDTLFDVKKRIVGSTYPKAFKVRNVRFPSLNWRVDKIAVGGAKAGSFRSFKSGDINNMFGTLFQVNLKGGVRDWTEKHVTGGTKTPRGSLIAIPTDDSMRNKGGSMAKRNKPMNITNKKDHFLARDKAGKKLFIAKRTKGSQSIDVKFVFAKQATIKPTFRFYEDAFDTIDRVVLPHWGRAMTIQVERSRFHAA